MKRNRERDIGQGIMDTIIDLVADPKEFGGTAIHRMLVNDPTLIGHIPEVRTVQRVVKRIRSNLGPLDSPFEWHRMQEFGLPWEAGGFVMRVWKWHHENVKPERERDFTPAPPTFRDAMWWWRIHLIDIEDALSDWMVWSIATYCVVRELRRDLLNIPLEMNDIEAFLAYKPWIEGNEAEYESAILEGRIPGIEGPTYDASESPNFQRAVRGRLIGPIGRPSLRLRKVFGWEEIHGGMNHERKH